VLHTHFLQIPFDEDATLSAITLKTLNFTIKEKKWLAKCVDNQLCLNRQKKKRKQAAKSQSGISTT
jgi:hypothetical protein